MEVPVWKTVGQADGRGTKISRRVFYLLASLGRHDGPSRRPLAYLSVARVACKTNLEANRLECKRVPEARKLIHAHDLESLWSSIETPAATNP